MTGTQLLTLLQGLMCAVSGPMTVAAAHNRIYAGAATFAALFAGAVVYLAGHDRLPWLGFAAPAAQLLAAALHAGWLAATIHRDRERRG